MKRIFNKPITEVIEARRSVRTFINKKLTKEVEEELTAYLKAKKSPLGSKVTFKLIDTDLVDERNGRIGTYGVISGATSYLVSKIKLGERELLDLGYTFEEIILFAASLNLGTCWLGGTFNRGKLSKLINVEVGELIPAITPIGYPAERKSLIDAAMSGLAASRKRKDWRQLFFEDSFDKVLQLEENNPYKVALEMVRLAPSAANKQPWRILRDKEGWHFFIHGEMKSKPLGFNMQLIDTGIAMCHFELTLREMGLKGEWRKLEIGIEISKTHFNYIISWCESH